MCGRNDMKGYTYHKKTLLNPKVENDSVLLRVCVWAKNSVMKRQGELR